MKVHRVLKIFIASFLVFYASTGVFARIVLGPPGEIFPVFTWALFARVPNLKHEYAVRILAVGNETLEPPRYFQDAVQWFKEAGYAYYIIQRLGAAVSGKEANSIEEVRRFFERVYLGEMSGIRYEVVERAFNPVEHWKYGTVKSVRSLGVFESFGKEK